MPNPHKFQKSHFLLLGSALVLLSAFLWYWNWRSIGLPTALRPEHFLTIVSYVVGVIILGIFVYRLTRRQVTIVLVGMIVVNLLVGLATSAILRDWPTFFEWIRPYELADYDPSYVLDWQACFLAPALIALHIGLLLLWGESLVLFLVRKPGERLE